MSDFFEHDIDDAEFYDDGEEIANTSLYSMSSNVGVNYNNQIHNNTTLKNGIIVKTYEIDDKLNLNKKTPEYDVLIVEQKGQSTMEPVVYKNCISIDGFGGVADFFEYKLRPVKEKEDESKTPLSVNFKQQFGNMVLLLCLDGSSDKGVIVKSVPHQGRKTNLTKEAGVHLEGEYNGLNWKVNKEGELTVTFKSKTDDKGKPQDETAGGTHLQIDKTGSIDFNTNDEASLKLDKPGKNIVADAGNDIGLTAKNNIDITATSNINGKAKAEISFEAEGSAKFTSKSTLNIEGKSMVEVKGGNVMVNAQNGITAKATQVSIESPLVLVGSGAAPALILSTMFIGTGNLGGPVVSSAVGPFSSTVFIAP